MNVFTISLINNNCQIPFNLFNFFYFNIRSIWDEEIRSGDGDLSAALLTSVRRNWPVLISVTRVWAGSQWDWSREVMAVELPGYQDCCHS